MTTWVATVLAPEGGPVYRHIFEAHDATPSELLREIAEALDLSGADEVNIEMRRAAT